MSNTYTGKLALITGGSSGIGLELAKMLYASGADLALLARDEAKLASAKAILEEQNNPDRGRVTLFSCDVSDYEAVNAATEQVQAKLGLPDFVFNCAGVARPGYVEELPIEVFKWTMDIDYHGTVNVIKACLPAFIKRGSGHFITISSLAGLIGTFGYTAYSAAKFAVRGFSDTLRAEMKPKGIRVSIVYPPDTDTPQLAWESQFKPPETAILAGSDKPLPVSTVAKNILDGVAKGKYVIVPGSSAKLMYWLAMHLGGLTYPLMDLLINNAIKKISTRK